MPKRDAAPQARANQLGLRLAQRRIELEMSGAEVARRAGIGEKRYNNYERNERRPDLVTLQRISAALKTTADELLSAGWHLLHRDADTYSAMVRFEEACDELNAEDVQMLADVAEVARRRRRDERQPTHQLGAGLRDLALAHERLVPSIIRTHKPRRVETAAQERANGAGIFLWIFVDYPPETDPDEAAKALLALAKERLGLPAPALVITKKEKNPRAVEVVLRVTCGEERR